MVVLENVYLTNVDMANIDLTAGNLTDTLRPPCIQLQVIEPS